MNAVESPGFSRGRGFKTARRQEDLKKPQLQGNGAMKQPSKGE